MEPEIRRTGYFNGQFLQEGEFIDEQAYHLHMRRRWSYALFNQSGVVQTTAAELVVTAEGGTSIRVAAGLAIGRVDDVREAREIVLREDEVVDLTAPPLGDSIGAGEVARITIHYEEEPVAVPASVGDVPGDTRVLEHARITVHNADPPPLAPNGEPYIRLSDVVFDTMTIVDTAPARQQARISSLLLGAALPSLTGITLSGPGTVVFGGNINLTATGQFSSGPDQVLDPTTLLWASSNPAIATVDANGQVTGGPAPGTTDITAASGPTTSPPFGVTVVPPLGIPTISPWPAPADRRRRGTETLTVFGDQFAAPMEVSFQAANPIDPRVLAPATVVDINTATVVVPGPLIPSPADPAVVSSGSIRVITPAGESADSPQPFILEIV